MRYSIDKDWLVNKTEYRRKRNLTGKPRWAGQTAKISGPNHLIMDMSLSRNNHKALSPTHRRAIKEENNVANRDWVDHQACSLLQYINVIASLFIIGNYFWEWAAIFRG